MVRTFEPSPPKPRPRRTSKVPWFFVAPALLLYLGLVVYPLISGAVVSFTDWRGLSPERNWVGWANFERLWADPQVQSALRNTLLLALAITVVQN